MSLEIRLKYSGLVIFLSRILSIFTGLIFSILLTRSLSTAEFGAWINLTNVLSTFGILSGVFPFWSARYTARRFEGAMKLGLLANVAIAIPAALLVILIGPFFASATSTSYIYYVFAAAILIESYAITATDSVVAVVRTHLIGYAFLVYEIIKLALLYPLLVIVHLGISAAILATFVANIGWLLIYVVALSSFWSQKINYRQIAHWIRGSPLNFYGVGAGLLAGLEGYVLLFRSGSVALAYFGAAALVVGPIGYTISLSAALYPKLLSGGSREDAEALFRMSLLFSIPLTVATVGLAPSLLALLNPTYVIAGTLLGLLAVRALTSTFGSMFDAVISGTEKLDAEGRIAVRATIRSRIFLSTSIVYGIFPVYLPLLWWILQRYVNDPIGAARTTGLAGLGVTLLSVGLKYLISRRSLPFRFPVSGALKFFLVAALLVSATVLLPQPLPPIATIAVFIAGTGLYFLILYFIDKEAKGLITSILRYTREMIW